MKEEHLLGGEVGVEQEEQKQEEEEEDNVGEVDEARWGMSFLSLLLLLHHLRSPKLFGPPLALANCKTLSLIFWLFKYFALFTIFASPAVVHLPSC